MDKPYEGQDMFFFFFKKIKQDMVYYDELY